VLLQTKLNRPDLITANGSWSTRDPRDPSNYVDRFDPFPTLVKITKIGARITNLSRKL